MAKAEETIQCFFCRDSFNERHKLEDHLIYQHGVVFNVDFMSKISKIKTTTDKLPVIDMNKKNNNPRLCKKCKDPAQNKKLPRAAPIPNREEKLLSVSRKENNDVTITEAAQTLEETVTVPPVDNNSDANGGAVAGAGAGGEDNSFVNVKVKPQNIRDKTNTYCNVCDVNLSTRILFLSHCSSVHDVKFKGKSGQPLVIPQDKDRTQPVSGKTGTSPKNNDGSGSPARKKIKLNTSITDPNNPRRAPVPCTFCGKVFSNLSNKERHERQSCKVVS